MNHQSLDEKQLALMLSEERSEIAGFEMTGLQLTELPLKGTIFIDCKFAGCNIANTSLLNVVFRDVVFENCNLMGINWTEVRTNGNYEFQGCKLDYGCFQSMDLRGLKMHDCSVREADFSGANLAKASLRHSLLTGTSFTNANLEKADFRGAKGYFIDPRFAKLKEAKFSFPEALILIQALGADVEI